MLKSAQYGHLLGWAPVLKIYLIDATSMSWIAKHVHILGTYVSRYRCRCIVEHIYVM
jgi:hypothetical protein